MPRNDTPIHLFLGGSQGFGDSINIGRDAYHWAVNWDCSQLGGSTPAQGYATISMSATTFYKPAADLIEWEDDATRGVPLVLVPGFSSALTSQVLEFKNATVSSAGPALTSAYTAGVLYRNDGADANAEMAYFCNGAANDVVVQRNKAGTYSQTAHTAKFDLLRVVGSDLWATNGYRIYKMTAEADPGLSASYPTAIPVGRPTYPINEVLNLGGSPIVLKGDGIFIYNPAPSSATFEPVNVAITPHPDNGKGACIDGRGRLYYPTADGHILVLTFGFQNLQTPARLSIIDRDTPFGRITAMTADLDYIYAATEPGTNNTFASGLGMKVFIDDTSFTDSTTAVTDGSWATYADIGTVAAATPDSLWIGADEPFLGAYIKLARVGAGNGLLVMAYGTTGGAYTTITTTSYDSTCGFVRDGAIVPANSTFGDLYANGPWIKTTVNSTSKYWLRIRPAATETFTSVRIREIALIPYRPPLDASVFPITSYAMAGALPKMLVGRWEGEDITWHDRWTLPTSRVDRMIVTRADTTLEGDRWLFAATREGYWFSPVGLNVRPIRQPWPFMGTDPKAIAFSGYRQPDGHVWSVPGKVVVDMPYVQAADEVWFYHWWDEDTDKVYKQNLRGSPMALEGLEGQGTVLYTALAFSDAARSAVAPVLRTVTIPAGEWADLGPQGLQKADTASPQKR